jgi:thioredoxin reductase/Pyruvate/2-oxoacid:ferredoxin oxidoreductase delta subunit
MTEHPIIFYGLLMLLIWAGYLTLRNLKQSRAQSQLLAAQTAGLTQPASLHPVINSNVCIGCCSCISACPEQNVLGLIRDKAELINPTHCIGHGACKTACPMNAISLVFGTAERGVDIPLVSPDFETNVPGIYIAGELGGMGLIRNAVEQGRQAMASIIRSRRQQTGQQLDVLIIGAGPAGLSASLAAHEQGLRYITVEQDSLGGTVAHFPRGKVVMTAPVNLPIVGKMNFREISKEALLEFWEKVIADSGVGINFSERVETVSPAGNGFVVKTACNSYQTASVLLAIGRRGTPRKLGAPGEDSAKVVYRLIDPEQYRGRSVLVVGGGDSALEAAASIAEQAESCVSLSYRSASFSRAKEKNRNRVAELSDSGRLKVLMSSNVVAINEGNVVIDQQGTQIELQNDAVIVCAGGILPTGFLKETGIEVETKYGTS